MSSFKHEAEKLDNALKAITKFKGEHEAVFTNYEIFSEVIAEQKKVVEKLATDGKITDILETFVVKFNKKNTKTWDVGKVIKKFPDHESILIKNVVNTAEITNLIKSKLFNEDDFVECYDIKEGGKAQIIINEA